MQLSFCSNFIERDFWSISRSESGKCNRCSSRNDTPVSRVRRGNQIKQIKSEDLVPGDIILLEAGDIIPADVRFISAHNLKVEEAALTGESVPVEKMNKLFQKMMFR